MCRLLHQARTRLTHRPSGTQGLKALNMSQREQLTAAGACFLLPPPIALPARAAALPPPCAFLPTTRFPRSDAVFRTRLRHRPALSRTRRVPPCPRDAERVN